MKYRLFLEIFLVIGIILASGCTKSPTGEIVAEDTSSAGVEQQQPATQTQEPKEEIKKSLLTTTYKYEEQDSKGKIVVNNLKKTATADLEMQINDTMEYEFAITFTCGLIALSFYNSSAIQEMQEEEFLVAEEESEETKPNFLEGVSFERFAIYFVDKEDGSKIADCIVKGKSEEDLEFKWYNTTTEEELAKQQEEFWSGFGED